MDGDGDGFVSPNSGGTDCDDFDASIMGPRSWYRDDDGDGYGNNRLPPVVQSCFGPGPTASNSGDCDDRDPLVRPDQAEFRCDGKDDNCDSNVDEGFNVGNTCTSSQGAQGVIICDPADQTRAICSGS
ncbi:MopE-related protein [Corallococcus exiguus]|uniref:MopE-related protein n=1 Tax=Corallococcus exiguus TaxID=83462 RepID=UPI003457530A